MVWSEAIASSVACLTANKCQPFLYSPPSSLPLLSFLSSCSSSSSSLPLIFKRVPPSTSSLLISLPATKKKLICRAVEYKFPDPIPEFAEAEIEKFRTHLLKKLSKKDIYGDSVEEVVRICTEILDTFLHTEYGGPGTLLVVPFIDMADTLNERGLPGGPQAARAAVVWAQKHVDKDWNEWTAGNEK